MPPNLERVVRNMTRGEYSIKLQLVVLAVGINRCLLVHIDCALETQLRYVSWVSVMGRIEELCNVVVFYITNWAQMEKALGLKPWDNPPKSATVSVTKRGTLTLRLTWDGTEWYSNDIFYEALNAIASFVRNLI